MKNTMPVKLEKKVAPAASTAPTEATAKTPSNAPAARPSDDTIRELAHEKWCAAGCPESDGVEFWLEAERHLDGSGKS